MIQLPEGYREKVLDVLLESRKNFDGSDAQYAKQYGINGSVFSRLKNDESPDGLLRDAKFLEIGQRLGVNINARKWVTVETAVYKAIHESMVFCQQHSKSFMLVDDAGIGKTYTAKHLAHSLKNVFYIDGSQAKAKIEFIRLLARTIGIEDSGKVSHIKAQIKYLLKVLPRPLVIIDEAGDLDDKTFLEIKELWNATEGLCGWYMMGADGLQNKIERNINNKKPGFTEIFSRFGERYNKLVPADKSAKQDFYRQLITDVIRANMTDQSKLGEVVKKCLTNDSGKISGLRRAESLVLIHDAA
ncbi:MAG: ATP-binding protein [Edaphocola sp.]